MKNLGQKNICAFIAILLAVTIVTSVDAKSNENEIPMFEEDLSYLEDLQAYVDAELAPKPFEMEASPEIVKVYDHEGDLVLQGTISELSENGLKLVRQADYLSAWNNTKYYRLK